MESAVGFAMGFRYLRQRRFQHSITVASTPATTVTYKVSGDLAAPSYPICGFATADVVDHISFSPAPSHWRLRFNSCRARWARPR
jgi:hypothetical protein